MTAEQHNVAGIALARQGRFAEAVTEFRQACELRPGYVEATYNLAKSLKDAGRLDESIVAYQRTLALDPKVAAAWNNLGNLLKNRGLLDEAIDSYQNLLNLEPQSAEAWSNLGAVLQEKGELDKAIEAYQRALSLRPQLPDASRNLGAALYEVGRPDEAVGHFQQALRSRLDFAEAYHGLGVALYDLGRYGEAVDAFRKGLSIRPDDPSCTYALGLALLLQGKLPEGFTAYEARHRIAGARVARDFKQPRWDGSNLEGQCIFLHAEQGLGDAIQFVRYAPLVRQRGLRRAQSSRGRVIVQCPSSLRRLLAGQLGIQEIYNDDQTVPSFDVHCPMLSLPLVFQTTLETIPPTVPYLRADPKRAAEFAARILSASSPPRDSASHLNVGLVWAGGREHKNDRNRSLTLADFQPLLRVPSMQFFSLQKGNAGEQVRGTAAAELTDWTADLFDFADTAALIANLDLVISVDTAVAHLAGAMGKPVWVLLPFVPDWRWMLERTDSPWYPTMRLFRQAQRGQWDVPLKQIEEALSILDSRPRL